MYCHKLKKRGINAPTLSHNQTMEKENQQNQVQTKDISTQNPDCLTKTEAEEYRLYKQRKRLDDAAAAMTKTQTQVAGCDDVQLICQRARRLKQAAVRVPLSKLAQAKYYLSGSDVALDCAVGGNGETLAKVKAYEARIAARHKAKEITVPIAPSLLDSCRYGDIRREIRRVKRAVGKADLKVRVERTHSPTALSTVARIACDLGAKYFSVPYFDGCERLKNDLLGECRLEVTDVRSIDKFQKMLTMGVSRIGVERAFETYTQLLKDSVEEKKQATVYETNKENTLKQEVKKEGDKSDKEYYCFLENGELKFL